MKQPRGRLFRQLLPWVSVGAVVSVASAQSVASVQDILVNPSAYHRQAIVLHGVVETPGEIRGVNGWGQQLCGQQFLLNDQTGRMLLRSVTVCQADGKELRVRHGETVTVDATVEAAPSNVRTVTGRGLNFGAIVTHVQHEDLGSTHVSIEPMR